MNIRKYVILKDITIDNVKYAGSVSFRSIFVGCSNTLEEAEDQIRKDAPPAMNFNTVHNPGSFWGRYNNNFDIVEEFQSSTLFDKNCTVYYILKINDTSKNDEEKESLKRRNQKLEEQVENLKKRLNSIPMAATYKESPKKEFKAESKNKDGFYGISFFSRD